MIKRWLLAVLFISSLGLTMSENPWFPISNLIGAFLIGIIVLYSNLSKDRIKSNVV